ncbi:AmmeMemoRadiSam system protein B [Pseudomonas jinjuensis]|uniref:MEMO1 family protein SAMN05216193_107125 n=1 Tax=Pseudomonas jinjuensis TaxID=198616 RepID=A0A1H0GB31_9PSED|nr:AmmeMemoRadiSam system protein B [Pseudomonas jinjuensis]SDO04097.1 hypothetical protein SAMN05216193_107125 [Pseudomonas jinjuensis]
MSLQSIRPAAVAGFFYPGEPHALAAQLRQMLDHADAPSGAPPKALIVPHAGYVYSGPIAAQGYAQLAPLRDVVRRVLLLGPSHRVAFEGAALPAASAFDTPLGRVEVDVEAVARLAALPGVLVDDRAHAFEHALEVQLPFLQTVLEDFRIVPLTLGLVEPKVVAALLDELWGGPETLIVVSSDLSHYLEYQQARRIDAGSAEHVMQLQADLDHEQACGATGINALLLSARRHQLTPHLLDLRNSGDTAGDHSRVVGYASFAFSEAPAVQRLEPDVDRQALGRALLGQARDAIDECLGLARFAAPAEHQLLDEPGACFVTLTLEGQLRGCIGRLVPERSLREDVRANARAAATEDPRFLPLSEAEWAETRLEVSLLSPIHYRACPDVDSALELIEPGVHGVVLEGGGQRSTFLPQVWQQLPDPREFLQQLLQKAGLSYWPADMQLGLYRVWAHHERSDVL